MNNREKASLAYPHACIISPRSPQSDLNNERRNDEDAQLVREKERERRKSTAKEQERGDRKLGGTERSAETTALGLVGRYRMVEFVDKQVDELKKLWSNKRQLAFQGLNLAMIVLSALMIWKSLMVVTKSESPVVVVLR